MEELTQPNADVMKIKDVIKCVEECKPWIACGIMAINNGMNYWCYKACGNCGKKVEVAQKGDMSVVTLNATMMEKIPS
ncbi:hypothetical protein PIB30_049094 [Stylosanthes scabra]|uniref:Uncharacterized protein n=1 Tax=Stylosanthes scabra TaxID=79078 RepID=A0ABU6SI61_9FABA|nr:hypothetical protein [Stylosanthes scabra]